MTKKAEEIVLKLRQVDVLVAQGRPVSDAARAIGVTEVTYYRWLNECGGLTCDQVKRLKELEAENVRLRLEISELTLDKLILRELAKENFFLAPRRAECTWTTSGDPSFEANWQSNRE